MYQTKLKSPSPKNPPYNNGGLVLSANHRTFQSGAITPEPWSMDLETLVALGVEKLGTCFMGVTC